MANVTIAFQANGGYVDYTPRLMSDPQGTRTVKDGSKQDLDGKKNGQVRLSLPTNKDFVVADAKKHWIVTKGKVSAGKPNDGSSYLSPADFGHLQTVGRRLQAVGNDDEASITVLKKFLQEPRWQGLLAKKHIGWMPDGVKKLGAKNPVYQAWLQGGGKSLKTLIGEIVTSASDKRQTAVSELTKGLGRLYSNTNPLLDPSFISSDLLQLARGAQNYQDKLSLNLAEIQIELNRVGKNLDFLSRTSASFLKSNPQFVEDINKIGQRLETYLNSVTQTLRNVRGDFKRIKRDKDREAAMSKLTTALFALGSLASVGFAFSNFTATAAQKLVPTLQRGKPGATPMTKAQWNNLTPGGQIAQTVTALNFGASFGSSGLLTVNTSMLAMWSMRLDRARELAGNVGAKPTILDALEGLKDEFGRYTMFFANVNKVQGKTQVRVEKQSGWHRANAKYPLDDKLILKDGRVGYYSFKQQGGMTHGDGKWTDWHFNSWPESTFANVQVGKL